MAKVSKSILFAYNKCAELATKWQNILDSYRHKDEKIPLSALEEDITVEVIDNLTSTDLDKPLSANQGKVLKDQQDANTANLLLVADKVKNYQTGEVLNENTSDIFRFYNGNIYEYIGAFPFTTLNIDDELGNFPENNDPIPPKWVAKISTYPKPDFVIFEPPSILPQTLRTLRFTGSYLDRGTTVDFGPEVNVSNYVYVSETEFFVDIQTTTTTLQKLQCTVNNGKEVVLVQELVVSNGELFIPGTTTTPFILSTGLTTSLGEAENLIADTTARGYSFGPAVSPSQDFILSFVIDKVNINTSSLTSFGVKSSRVIGSTSSGFLFSQSVSYNSQTSAIENDAIFQLIVSGDDWVAKAGNTTISSGVYVRTANVYPIVHIRNQMTHKNIQLLIV